MPREELLGAFAENVVDTATVATNMATKIKNAAKGPRLFVNNNFRAIVPAGVEIVRDAFFMGNISFSGIKPKLSVSGQAPVVSNGSAITKRGFCFQLLVDLYQGQNPVSYDVSSQAVCAILLRFHA
ncbi:MAG TPA: hypothetical protein VGJ55_06465 [Pyrinomonadaceae bacterium]